MANPFADQHGYATLASGDAALSDVQSETQTLRSKDGRSTTPHSATSAYSPYSAYAPDAVPLTTFVVGTPLPPYGSSSLPPPLPHPSLFPRTTILGPQTPPTQLGRDWLYRGVLVFVDVCFTALGALFLAFAWLVFQADGSPAESADSWGQKLDRIAQYTPTVFPVLFGAAVGGALKRIATYAIQSRDGLSVRTLEQLLGSQSIYRAFATQFKLGAFNFLALFLLLLWCLSPLGGQAALRVIRLTDYNATSSALLHALPTFVEYQFGMPIDAAAAKTTVKAPVVASILGASLLSKRNQDLWGNIRLPSWEQAVGSNTTAMEYNANDTTPWSTVSSPTNLTYANLVGVPLNNLSTAGNNTFVLAGAYVTLACPVYTVLSDQTALTNFSSPNVTAPTGDFDCEWFASGDSGSQYQIAMSLPCDSDSMAPLDANSTRPARQVIWESSRDYKNITHAECLLTTTYVEAEITCTSPADLNDGTADTANTNDTTTNATCFTCYSAADSTCTPARVRRTVSPDGYDGNWTVLDAGTTDDVSSVIDMLTALFPSAVMTAREPVPVYMANPLQAVGIEAGDPADVVLADTVPVDIFALRLAQLLNSILYVGIEPTAISGSFTSNMTELGLPPSNITAVVTTTVRVVRYSRVWLAWLTICAVAIMAAGLVGAVLHLRILAPDVLETVAVSFLPNRFAPGSISGNTAWDASRWAQEHGDVRLVLADVTPDADVGRIALSTVGSHPVAQLARGRWYA